MRQTALEELNELPEVTPDEPAAGSAGSIAFVTPTEPGLGEKGSEFFGVLGDRKVHPRNVTAAALLAIQKSRSRLG